MAAGGTGGHVFPALAIARAFQEKRMNVQILFVGTPRGMEKELVPSAGFPLELMQVSGLKGKGWFYRIRSLMTLPRAFFSSWKLLKTFRPDTVFGIGGYASGPILLMAALTGKKTAILEPNAVAGLSNRVLGKFVYRVFVAFQEAGHFFASKKVIHSGNPIRKEILNVPPPSFEANKLKVLVFGGSQGARSINQAVIDALPKLKESGIEFSFIHQTGLKDEKRVREAFLAQGIEADVFAFSGENMAQAYEQSHVVLARGGSSVLEIAACGRPSIVVPYPFSADDHQWANGCVMQKAGASVLVKNDDLNGSCLAGHLIELAKNSERLKEMSHCARKLRFDQAAERIVEEIEEMS